MFIGQVLGLSVLSLELTKTYCLLNGVLDVSLGFILPLVHALCSRWAGSELALLNSLSEMLLLRINQSINQSIFYSISDTYSVIHNYYT